MKTLIVLIVAVLFSQTSLAEIYRWVDEAGNIIYSDKPHKNAEEVKLPGITSYTGQPVTNAINSNQVPKKKVEKYISFKISEPVNDVTIRDNTGRVAVVLSVKPGLYTGHTVVYEVDGQESKQKTTTHTFTGLDRGTHVLKAYIINSQGMKVTPVVSSQFHLKRASILLKPKPKAP